VTCGAPDGEPLVPSNRIVARCLAVSLGASCVFAVASRRPFLVRFSVFPCHNLLLVVTDLTASLRPGCCSDLWGNSPPPCPQGSASVHTELVSSALVVVAVASPTAFAPLASIGVRSLGHLLESASPALLSTCHVSCSLQLWTRLPYGCQMLVQFCLLRLASRLASLARLRSRLLRSRSALPVSRYSRVRSRGFLSPVVAASTAAARVR
jgi:hypothetical protein